MCLKHVLLRLREGFVDHVHREPNLLYGRITFRAPLGRQPPPARLQFVLDRRDRVVIASCSLALDLISLTGVSP
jgi:hypothetical protein